MTVVASTNRESKDTFFITVCCVWIQQHKVTNPQYGSVVLKISLPEIFFYSGEHGGGAAEGGGEGIYFGLGVVEGK